MALKAMAKVDIATAEWKAFYLWGADATQFMAKGVPGWCFLEELVVHLRPPWFPITLTKISLSPGRNWNHPLMGSTGAWRCCFIILCRGVPIPPLPHWGE